MAHVNSPVPFLRSLEGWDPGPSRGFRTDIHRLGSQLCILEEVPQALVSFLVKKGAMMCGPEMKKPQGTLNQLPMNRTPALAWRWL